MALNEQEIQALGATIANADNDGLGLKTDGNGTVNVPDDSNFMTEVLKLNRKYFILADCDHYTYEQLFNKDNVIAMRRAGVKLVFDEGSRLENLQFLQQVYNKVKNVVTLDRLEGIEFDKSPAVQNDISSYLFLKTAGIDMVASDTRAKTDASMKQIYDLKDNITEETDMMRLSHVMLARGLTSENAQRIIPNEQAVLREYFGNLRSYAADWEHIGNDPTITHDQNMNRYKFTKIVDEIEEYLQGNLSKAAPQSPEYVTASKQLTSLARVRSLINPQRPDAAHEATIDDMIEFHNVLEKMEFLPQIRKSGMALSKNIRAEADDHNPGIAQNIATQSAPQKKVMLRWGLGHFDGTKDINEYLGAKNCVVIATVASTQEFKEKLAYFFIHPPKDMPDYLYMPPYVDANGFPVPEQAVSVAEYLKVEKAKEANLEKTMGPQSQAR